MTLYLFNPEHDLALASGLERFTAPHAARQLRHDLGWLPALWADAGFGEEAFVLVDDVESAQTQTARYGLGENIRFVEQSQLAQLPIDRVDPWGWDIALHSKLLQAGLCRKELPAIERLEVVKQHSHRRTAAQLLPRLRMEHTVGVAYECSNREDVDYLLRHYDRLVLKAPWSSSGRGIRFVCGSDGPLSASVEGWMAHVFEQQGTVMAEPYYNKIRDLGMEFVSDGQGNVEYTGLSLFHTENGAYKGNIVATEERKWSMLGSSAIAETVHGVQQKACSLLGPLLKGKYAGPLGIDMMVVAPKEHESDLELHPCVEVNLRRTMGHVALALGKLLNPDGDEEIMYVMRIDYNGTNYKLQIRHL